MWRLAAVPDLSHQMLPVWPVVRVPEHICAAASPAPNVRARAKENAAQTGASLPTGPKRSGARPSRTGVSSRMVRGRDDDDM